MESKYFQRRSRKLDRISPTYQFFTRYPTKLMIMKFYIIILLAISTRALSSCETFLDEKSSAKIASPSSTEDVELLLKDYGKFNAVYPYASEIASDNFFVSVQHLNGASERERRTYRWEPNDDVGPFWSFPYSAIFSANIILETLDHVKTADLEKKKKLYAMALFWRAFYHYALADLFCKPYMAGSAQTDLGIPLKRTADINKVPQRASVKETYDFIIKDIEAAIPSLDEGLSNKFQPNKAAGYGLLARIHLAMGSYAKAGLYADSCLRIQSTLVDYNALNTAQNIPFKVRNDEVILDVQASVSNLLNRARGRVDTLLVQTYDMDDLRLKAFFIHNADGTKGFKGHYSGASAAIQFVGLATDEMFLIRAECNARAGDIDKALVDLNTLLKHRWQKERFVELTGLDKDELLHVILLERRKELLFRCLRWSDLKRLNQENRFKKTLKRKLDDDDMLALEPNGERYVFKILRESILFSGIEQNP
ncbi:RagB/SusD family nutrient uptake outer membrane protein [Sphingobacterium olei]|uniref:RagB/SusD family nutrient uptake outer membrane protein n=2 Tax=Sphingobacterium olei TaxID=2571155 RepID=A0A4U0P0M9_9SPHI|nr:RagB/SusD family nutrient uptake outer membrane protein [Sphingobacterium olei]